jgi:tRNA(fMet)-specific endonuclease VapC
LNVARLLLDTNICIYIRRRRPPAVLARFRQLKPGEAVLSVITYGEPAYSAEKRHFREQARRQLAELGGVASGIGAPVSRRRILWVDPRRAGSPGDMIGNNDLWIAAHAKAAGSLWSPITNARFDAFMAWKFRIGRTDPSHRAQPCTSIFP